VVTSYCTITKIDIIKDRGKEVASLNDFIDTAGHKTVFNVEELGVMYKNKNVVLIELIYNGYFGKGHNVNHSTLNKEGLFPAHPYNIEYTQEQFKKILGLGEINVQSVIVD
jgi:hypothetical protein